MSTRTLVLDPGFQPHGIVEWQRAVSMIFQSKAELVAEYDEPCMTDEQADTARANSWTLILKVPAVVRLLRHEILRKKSVKFSRINVLTRDNFTCQYCGKRLAVRKLNYDHVVPRSRGGRTVWENIVTACYPCNARKDNRTPREARMRLRKPPVKPRSLPIVAYHFDTGGGIPDAWRSYIYWHAALEQG
jgi:5-methylcytosine-specific restriction endonuclease McrA